jgi:predicted methyltransferase
MANVVNCGRGCAWCKSVLAGALLLLISLAPPAGHAWAGERLTESIAAAVFDPSRPDTDKVRDANRRPQETLAFAGSGYFTRLFAAVVGPEGHVYASVPSALYQYPNIVKGTADIETYATSHPNVTVTFGSALDAAKYPEKLDLFWISQNYHDLHDRFMGPVDMAAFNKAVYAALKPGGAYIVLDHVAAKGSAADVTESLHRIEPSTVRREAEAAGFKFDDESGLLANPADPHTLGPFDPSIQGRTDQFILKFRKPL